MKKDDVWENNLPNNVSKNVSEILKSEKEDKKENISAPLYLWAHYIKIIKDMKGGAK